MKHSVRRLTLAALLAALALILFVVEAQLPPLAPVPGIKIGLANTVSLFAVFALGPWYGVAVLLVRILLGGFFTGSAMAILYSLSGGLLSMLVCCGIYRFFPLGQVWVVSALCAMVHNVGQIFAAIAIASAPELVYYLPLLLISGILSGSFTGLCAQLLLSRLERAGLVRYRGKGPAGDL